MKIRRAPLPQVDKSARLKPKDFSEILRAVPYECVLIGGQAVVWWAERYGVEMEVRGEKQDITSRDIDFWGSSADLIATAKALSAIPAFPDRREMTALAGAIGLSVAGKRTALEMLHAVPGIDSNDPFAVAMEERLDDRKLLVLSPVSLVLAKLHALRHFDQTDRQDLFHLQVSLRASELFIAEGLAKDLRFALWNCNRLINAHRQKPNQRLEREHSFQILSAIPIISIQTAAQDTARPAEARKKLNNFLAIQWPRVKGGPDVCGL